MTQTKLFLRAFGLIAIIGFPLALCFGLARHDLSARQWGLGLLVWFAALFLWALIGKLLTSNRNEQSVSPNAPIDDGTRQRLVREVRTRKIWIGVLAVLLPVGVAEGFAHDAWVPTLTGAAVSILFISAALRNIKRVQRRLTLGR